MLDVEDFKTLKGKKRITALTCYDYCFANVLKDSSLDFLLVGDSLGMVIYGDENTHNVGVEEMFRHAQAVSRGTMGKKMIVVDLPKKVCVDADICLGFCMKLKNELGLKIVKIEGNTELASILIKEGFEVMGHVGLKPQEVEECKVKGRGMDSELVFSEALELERVGCFSLILECVPAGLGGKISKRLLIPVIGIGAGKDCDGQILVLYDVLGLYGRFTPRFVRKYVDLSEDILEGVQVFVDDVEGQNFPNKKESF